MLPVIIPFFWMSQVIWALPAQPNYHPAVFYDAVEHRLYFDVPPEIFIANGKLCPNSSSPVTATCQCDTLIPLMCSVGQICIPRQGSVTATCVAAGGSAPADPAGRALAAPPPAPAPETPAGRALDAPAPAPAPEARSLVELTVSAPIATGPIACQTVDSPGIRKRFAGGVCTCRTEVCTSGQYCSQSYTCVQAPICSKVITELPCKCGDRNSFCTGSAFGCYITIGLCA